MISGRAARQAGVSLLRLEALPVAEAEQLARATGQQLPSPDPRAGRGTDGGEPFFAEELIATLAERGVLARRNGGWSFGELRQDFFVPDTVQAVLAARIDLLPGPGRRRCRRPR